MRLYIKKETDKAYLLYGLNFAERWVPKKAVKIITNSDKLGIFGISHEMTIEKWALNLNNNQ